MEGRKCQTKIEEIYRLLRNSRIYLEMRKDLREYISKSNIPVQSSELKENITSYIISSGWKTKLQNTIFQEIKRTKNNNIGEEISYIKKAQAAWEKKVLKSINSMCTELSWPLARKRSTSDQADIASKFTTLGSECNMSVLSKVRPVYSTSDFLGAVMSVKNPNCSQLRGLPNSVTTWGKIQVQLKVKNLQELRSFYKELEHCGSQCGSFDTENNCKDLYDNDWYRLGNKVIENSSSPAAQQYARYGCPTGLRRHFWSLILGIRDHDQNKVYYEQLKAHVYEYDLLVDTLVKKDVKSTATNDDQYFVFEDLLYQILLVFTRDTYVLKLFDDSPASPPKSYIRGKLGVDEFAVFYPPNGVIPVHGFSMYVAPLCYVYEDGSQLYHTFRAMYMRYFSRLHSISSQSQGILSLGLLFETLLQSKEPALFYHLKQIGVDPLRTAFNWMFYAFSGYLESEQVLILWDRILGYDSLEILAVLAHSIFAFRGKNLFGVSSQKGAEAVLNDITDIKVIPLLQRCLFLR